jgi:hypothetical protein
MNTYFDFTFQLKNNKEKTNTQWWVYFFKKIQTYKLQIAAVQM